MKAHFSIRKVIKIVLYRLVHGIWYELIVNLYNVGAFTIQNTLTLCVTFWQTKRNFTIFMFIHPWGNVWNPLLKNSRIWLAFNILQVWLITFTFHYFFTHLEGLQLPQKIFTIGNVVLTWLCKVFVTWISFFWSVCVGQQGGVHDGGQFKYSNLYRYLQTCDS